MDDELKQSLISHIQDLIESIEWLAEEYSIDGQHVWECVSHSRKYLKRISEGENK